MSSATFIKSAARNIFYPLLLHEQREESAGGVCGDDPRA
jgi:hypothetical protein